MMTVLESEATPIQKFYKGSIVFITGATGLLGTLLIEKLLRECPDIETIYILIRNKKGKSIHQRIEQSFNNVIFDELREKFPKFLHKIVGIEGDCSLPNLGLSSLNRKVLATNVNVVFHVAANVKFDETLKIAAKINVRSACEMIKLAREMENLKSFIHVSTAFSNCIEKVIDERIYHVDTDYKELLLLTEVYSDEELKKLKPSILNKHPNTYTFTKQIAEDAVKQCGEGIPIGIFRPSIVSSTYREPLKGWSNNYHGVIGVYAAAWAGIMRTIQADIQMNANLVPADMCANSMIAAAWDVNDRFENGNKFNIPVYDYESNSCNPVDWKSVIENNKKYIRDIPSSKAMWYFSLRVFKWYFVYSLYAFFTQTIPALTIDGIFLCTGKKPRMMAVCSKVNKFSSLLSYFATKSWVYNSQNIRSLINKMSRRDRKIFNFDLREINWEEYSKIFVNGLRVYIHDESPIIAKEDEARWKRLYWSHQALKAFLFIVVPLNCILLAVSLIVL